MGENMSDDDRSRLSIAELQSLKPYGDSDVPAMSVARARLVNATPVLLEVAAAALALRKQEGIAAKARFAVYSSLNKNAVPSDENYAASGREDSKLAGCRAAYLVALAKVRE